MQGLYQTSGTAAAMMQQAMAASAIGCWPRVHTSELMDSSTKGGGVPGHSREGLKWDQDMLGHE